MSKSLFHEYEIDCQNQADRCGEMIPVKGLVLECDRRKNGEYRKCDNFLYDFELYKSERSSVFLKSDAVGRYLETILE